MNSPLLLALADLGWALAAITTAALVIRLGIGASNSLGEWAQRRYAEHVEHQTWGD